MQDDPRGTPNTMRKESTGQSTYTYGHAPVTLRSQAARTAEECCAYLLPYLQPTMKILDIGCGPGLQHDQFARSKVDTRRQGLSL